MWRIEIEKIRVSGFSNITETKLPYQCLLLDVLDSIKHPSAELKSCISQIRHETDHNKQDELKVKLLPVFCFSGVFSERKDDGLIGFNPIICLDLDDVNDLDAERERLKSIPYVLAFFTSPTGTGLKVLVHHTLSKSTYHKDLYNDLGKAMGFIGRTDLKFDLSCSNVSRACFLSADPKLWLNKDTEPYHTYLGYDWESFDSLFSKKVITPPPTPPSMPTTTTKDIVFPSILLTDYKEIRKKIQDSHTLFEAHYSMYPGCRNKNLYILASFFRYDGIPEDIATDYLVAYYQDDLNGFPASEIKKTVHSVYN